MPAACSSDSASMPMAAIGLEARIRHGASLTQDMLTRDIPRSYLMPADVPEALGRGRVVGV